MDAIDFLGAHGGQIALAFGAGCVAGYGFCMRTIYQLSQSRSEKEHQRCLDRIMDLEKEKDSLLTRMKDVEDRVYSGQLRQLEQIRESSVRILGGSNIGGRDDGI